MGAAAVFFVVYLTAKGTSELTAGIIISAMNLLIVYLQPKLARLVEESENFSLIQLLQTLSLVAVLLAVLMIVFDQVNLLAIIFISLIFLITFLMIPFIASMSMHFINKGINLNYGLIRSMGSLGFALTTAILGGLVENYGLLMIPISLLIGYLLVFTMMIFMKRIESSLAEPVEEDLISLRDEPDKKQEALFKKYPTFFYVLLGSFFFFAFHNMVSTYMISIVEMVGGSERHLGYAMAIGALSEMPVMIFYGKIQDYASNQKLLLVSAFAFFFKAIALFVSSSIAGVYFAQFLQLFSFGLYAVASIYFTNDLMDRKDKLTGQAQLASVQTFSGVIGNLIGGLMIENLTVRFMLFASLLITALGSFSFYRGLKVTKKT